MKKKGLLISTIVMVVVLVASLTTATYAWFSATASVAIDTMSLKTSATEGLVLGVKGTTTGSDDVYLRDTAEWDTTNNYWKGSTAGLSNNIDLSVLNGSGSDGNYGLDVKKACTPWSPSGSALLTAAGYSGYTSGTAAYVSAYSVAGHSESADTTQSGANGVEVSKKNVDYIDLELGLAASSAGSVKNAYCDLIFSGLNSSNLGMTGALHLIVKVGGTTGKATSGTIIGSGNLGQDLFAGTTPDTKTIGVYDSTKGTLTVSFFIFQFDDTKSGSEKYMTASTETPSVTVEIIAWFEGYDSSCTNDNTGTDACTMEIKFSYEGLTTTGSGASISSGFVRS